MFFYNTKQKKKKKLLLIILSLDVTIIQRDIFNTLLTLDTEKFYMKLTNQLFEKEILNFDVVKKFIEEKVEQLMKKKKQQNHLREAIDY